MPSDPRNEHMHAFLGQADALVTAWRNAARAVLAKPGDPIALDNLAVQSAAVGQALQIVTARSEEFAGALLDSADVGRQTG